MTSQTYRIEEAAKLLGIGRNHCYELAKQDALPVPVIRLGKRIVVAKVALDKLLASEKSI